MNAVALDPQVSAGLIGASLPTLLLILREVLAGRRGDKAVMWDRITKLEARVESLEKERDNLMRERDDFIQELAEKNLQIVQLTNEIAQKCLMCPMAAKGADAQ